MLFAKSYLYSYLPLPEIKLLRFNKKEKANIEKELILYKNKEKKIALLLPTSTIKRYSIMVSNSVIAFLLASNEDFYLKNYDCKEESKEAFLKTLQQIKNDGFKYVIAPLTKKGAKIIAPLVHEVYLYIPTVNSKQIEYDNFLITYGGIDYEKQVSKLKEFLSDEMLIFDEPGDISQNITKDFLNQTKEPYRAFTMKTHVIKYENIFHSFNIDKNTTVIINTQPIKSSLILSQFAYQDINVSCALSTQINYSPMLLALTQPKDLQKLYIANSITTKDHVVEDINTLLHNDIVYNWINYSSSIMMDLIFQDINRIYSNKSLRFNLLIDDKQVQYPIGIYRVKYKRFYRFK